jgi:NAD(P)-dependent dehydrogenase (short-subunit alcohol dehydrogenase family)
VNDRAGFANGQAFTVRSSEHIVSFRSEQLKENTMSGTKNKVVAITGASSSIGEATALLLAERGATVVLGARGLDRLAALADRIVRTGGEAAYAATDVKRRDDLSALVKLACERYGKLDVLVNNAGVMPISPLDDLRVEDWEEMVDVNIKGVLYGIAAALPVFRAQKFGHFVNIASVAGLKTVPNEQRETIGLRCLQVGRQHVRPLGRHHEYVSRSKDGAAHARRRRRASSCPSRPRSA